jgi:hypothetical protein
MKVIGALHNGKIVEILRTSADTTGKPWSYVADETNGGVGFIGKRIVGPEPPHRTSQSRVPIATLIGRFSSMRRACSNDTVRSSCRSTQV